MRERSDLKAGVNDWNIIRVAIEDFFLLDSDQRTNINGLKLEKFIKPILASQLPHIKTH